MNKPTRWIIDDFLPEDELKELENGIYNTDFPWRTLYGVVDYNDSDKRMVHSLYNEPERSEFFNNFEPIYRELRAAYVLKAKINLDFKQHKTYSFHTDDPVFNKYNPAFYTGIFNFTDSYFVSFNNISLASFTIDESLEVSGDTSGCIFF